MKKPVWLIAFILCAISAHATFRTWVGGGANNKWSTAANWSPAGTPVNGDRLSLSVSGTTTVDDIIGLRLDELIVGNDQTILGTNAVLGTNWNVLVLDDDGDGIGITCGFGGGVNTVRVGIELGSSLTFESQAGLLLIGQPLNLNGHVLHLVTDAAVSTSVINFGDWDGRIFGSGVVHVESVNGSPSQHGDVQFSGSTGANNLTGFNFIRVHEYTYLTLKKIGGISINSRLEVGTNGTVDCSFNPQFAPSAEVVVYAGGRLLGGGEVHQMGTLEMHGNALVDSEGGTIVVRTNLIGDGTYGTPVIAGNLLLSNNVVLSTSGSATVDLDIPANIAGGSFSKTGVGVVVFRGTNTFTGTLSVNDGIVEARSPMAFGSTSGATWLNNGTIVLRGAAIGNEPLTCAGTEYRLDGLYGSLLFGYDNSSWAGTVTLNTNLVVYSGDTTTFSGSIQGPGGLDVFYDTVRLSGSAANTFTGPTWVHGLKLELNKSFNTPAVSPALIIGGVGNDTSEVRWLNSFQMPAVNSVTIYTNGLARITNFSELFGPLTFTGGRVNLGTSGTLNLTGTVTVNPSPEEAEIDGATSAGGLTLGLPTTCYMEYAATYGCDLSISSRITAGGINKIGSGILCLYGNSSYSGMNTISAGEIFALHNGALGNATAGTVVSNGATLSYGSSVTSIGDRVVLNGIGAYGPSYGALYADGTTTNSGQVSLGSSATIGVDSSGHFYIPSVMDGTGDLTKTGAGTLTLSGVNANTYLGQTFVNRGLMQLSKGGQVAIPNHVTIGTGQPGAPNATLRYLAGSSSAVVGNFTVNETGLLDFNGQSESFSLLGASFTLNGGGDVWLGGGTVTLPQGSLTVIEPGTSGASTIGNATNTGHVLLPANMFANTHTFAVNAAASPSGPELSIYANLEASSGTAHVIKSGAGTMRLSGNNTYTGQLAINDGKVTLASATATGAAGSSVIVNSNAVLAFEGSFTFNSETLNLNGTAPVQVIMGSGDVFWNGPVTLNKNSTIQIGAGGALETQNAITGSGTLTKTGAGQLYMSSGTANTYTNVTWVKEGDLLLNHTTINSTILGPLIIGDGVGGADADKVYVARVRQIANTVPVTIHSSGLLDIVSGKSDAFGALSGSGHVLLESSTDLEVGLDDGSSTFSGLITGSGNFWKHGTGTMILSGNNTHTGFTLVEGGGKLIINGSQPSSAVIVSNVATLGGSGTVGSITANNATISPGTSAGILSCASLSANSSDIVQIELNGLSPGSGHDQINVSGSVNLANAALNATLGFASAASNTFTIINKAGASTVGGTFQGLPQNAVFNISGIPFRISYTGGTGNDVVLTQLLPPPALTSMTLTGSNLRFSWPSNYTGFTLESNTNLNNSVWAIVSPSPVLSGTNYVVTNSVSGSQKYFRLRSP